MDLARKILQDYGWKDGDGLGKNKDGIAKPLKANLKFDRAGLGSDQAAADFNNHWWERIFNEAASNLNITKEGEQINMDLNDKVSVEISTKVYSSKKLANSKQHSGESSKNKNYENFLQASTLTNLGEELENPNKINTNTFEFSKVNVLTDEELFKACGGRTAHKGARHGLKLSGKLSRIEKQEAELLAKMMANRSGFSEDKHSKAKLVKKGIESEYIREKCEKPKKQTKCKDGAVTREVYEEMLKKSKRKHFEMESAGSYEDVDVTESSKNTTSNSKIKSFHAEASGVINSVPNEKNKRIKKRKKEQKNID